MNDKPWRPERVIGPAAVAAALLLLSLHQVVEGAVRQAAQQREQAARHAAALMRCDLLTDMATRDLCISRLKATLVASSD